MEDTRNGLQEDLGNVETLESRQRINGLGPRPERETIIQSILFSSYVRPRPSKYFQFSRWSSVFPSSLSPSSLSFSSFFLFYYLLARFQGYLPRQPPLSFLHFNTNDTSYIWQRRHSIRDTFARSEESINPPNECKLPCSRGKGLGLSANDDTGKNLPGEETHYYLGRRRVHLGRRVEPNANERGARVGG